MSLNQSYPVAPGAPLSAKLEGTDRWVDTLIGLIVVIATGLIGTLSLTWLFGYGLAVNDLMPSSSTDAGYLLALAGSVIPIGVGMIVYVVRVAFGRRSWGAPLVAAGIMTIALVVGYLIMSNGVV